jgi:hypothetical protein
LNNHFSSKSDLTFDCEAKLGEWRDERLRIDRELDFDRSNAEEKLKNWASLLDSFKSNSVWACTTKCFSGTTYDKKVTKIKKKVSDRFSQGKKALNDSDFGMVHECLHIMELIHHYLSSHIDNVKKMCEDLRAEALRAFLKTCNKAQKILDGPANKESFGGIFLDYCGIVKHLPCILIIEEAKKAFALTNQVIHDTFVCDIKAIINTLLETFEFAELKKKICRQGNLVPSSPTGALCLMKESRLPNTWHVINGWKIY